MSRRCPVYVCVSAHFLAAMSHLAGTLTAMSHNADRLAVIDLETTGLDPHTDQILEIGVVIIDEALAEVDAFSVLVDTPTTRLWAWETDRDRHMGADLGVAKEMHLANGLVDELLAAPQGERSEVISAVSDAVEGAGALIAAVLDRHDITDPVPMVGSSVRALDGPFLEVHAPALAARFTHRTIDASALTEFTRFVDPAGQAAVMSSIPDSGHRTLGDCRRSLQILRAFGQHYGIGASAGS